MRWYLHSSGAQRLLMATLVSLNLAACSTTKQSTVIPLKPQKLSTIEISQPASGERSFMEIRGIEKPTLTKGYVTALRTCGYAEKTSLRGTTRQIFVGLEKVKILNQDAAEFPPLRLWHVEAEAQSEGLPLYVSTYTLKQEQCFIDFVLWAVPPSQEVAPLRATEELAELRAQFHTLVGDTLPQL